MEFRYELKTSTNQHIGSIWATAVIPQEGQTTFYSGENIVAVITTSGIGFVKKERSEYNKEEKKNG